MIRKYQNHKLQTDPWHRESHNNHETPGRQTKQSNQLSIPNQDDCITKRDINKSNVQQNVEQLHVSSWRNTLIKLTHYDETKKRAHDSQIVRAKENHKLSHGNKHQAPTHRLKLFVRSIIESEV